MLCSVAIVKYMANVTNMYKVIELEGQNARSGTIPAPILFVNRMLEHTDDYQSVTILTGIIEWLGQVIYYIAPRSSE